MTRHAVVLLRSISTVAHRLLFFWTPHILLAFSAQIFTSCHTSFETTSIDSMLLRIYDPPDYRTWETTHGESFDPRIHGFLCARKRNIEAGLLRPKVDGRSLDEQIVKHVLNWYVHQWRKTTSFISVSASALWVIWECFRRCDRDEEADPVIAIIDSEALRKRQSIAVYPYLCREEERSRDEWLSARKKDQLAEGMRYDWFSESCEVLVSDTIDPEDVIGIIRFHDIRSAVENALPRASRKGRKAQKTLPPWYKFIGNLEERVPFETLLDFEAALQDILASHAIDHRDASPVNPSDFAPLFGSRTDLVDQMEALVDIEQTLYEASLRQSDEGVEIESETEEEGEIAEESDAVLDDGSQQSWTTAPEVENLGGLMQNLSLVRAHLDGCSPLSAEPCPQNAGSKDGHPISSTFETAVLPEAVLADLETAATSYEATFIAAKTVADASSMQEPLTSTPEPFPSPKSSALQYFQASCALATISLILSRLASDL